MKTRQGFVSNSSSSSYIIRLDKVSFNDLIDLLQKDYAWDWLNKEQIAGKIRDQIAQEEECLDELNQEKIKPDHLDNYRIVMLKTFETRIARLKDVEKKLNSSDGIYESALIIFEHFGIGVHDIAPTDFYSGGLELTYFTSMHNDYITGIEGFLQEIILFLLFETKIVPVCVRESDQD
jgi:hypothetical protein